MARAREVPEFDCDEPFAAAATRVVRVRADEVLEHTDGVLDIGEIDRVHDMRVATRRLRAALEVFEPCFPGKRHRKALKSVKALADALGRRRDRDVQIEFFTGFAEAAPEAERPALAARITALREEQGQANEDLAPHVAQEQMGKLRRRLERLVARAEP